ncbi:hypothetical protein DFS34DRAFT_691347 [Phlyctochytrium arcticum]|nr:hypothetical protein DFS34DRAFT_691347 [Phlyctochytrium arcticum]
MDNDRNDELAASKKAAEIFAACEKQPFTERVAGYKKIVRLVPKDQHQRWAERLGIPYFDKTTSSRGDHASHDAAAGQTSGSEQTASGLVPDPGAGGNCAVTNKGTTAHDEAARGSLSSRVPEFSQDLNPSFGLCNGTPLIVQCLGQKVIKAQILTGTNIVSIVFIPRILMTTNEGDMPFILKRQQFSMCVKGRP